MFLWCLCSWPHGCPGGGATPGCPWAILPALTPVHASLCQWGLVVNGVELGLHICDITQFHHIPVQWALLPIF